MTDTKCFGPSETRTCSATQSPASSLRQILERNSTSDCGNTVAISLGKNSNGGSKGSLQGRPTSPCENWANFEPLSSSKQQEHQHSSFVVFESSWNLWILSGRSILGHGENNIIAKDEEDCWMNRLLPFQQTTRKTPLLRRNPRDNNRRHVANPNYNNNTSDGSDHLSNEEWITQRRRRERRLRQRYRQEAEHMLGIQQVFRSNLDDMNEWERARRRVDRHRVMQHVVTDGQFLLDTAVINFSMEPHTTNEEQPTVTAAVPFPESTSTDIPSVAPRLEQLSTRPRLRPRRTPVTSQARRDRFQHWSSSAIQLSFDIVLVPWRTVVRNDDNLPTGLTPFGDQHDSDEISNSEHFSNHSLHHREASHGDINYSRDGTSSEEDGGNIGPYSYTSRMGISSEYGGSSSEEILELYSDSNELPPWPSGSGWRWSPEDEIDDEDDGHSETSGRTQYWSTGTAMETDDDTFISNENNDENLTDDSMSSVRNEDWESDLPQFPSIEEPDDDLHQYEFMPTPDDPLFPDDPFAGSF